MTFRYRTLDASYDMTFGRGGANFLVDSPAAVAQSILTRLLLWQGEWYLDLLDGTPWMQQILGKPRQPGLPDAAIRARILGTAYVTQITDYASVFESTARSLTISAKVFTAFGPVTVPPPGTAIAPSGALVMQFGMTPEAAAQLTALPGPQRLLTRG
jgi:hypothetical protein